MHWKWMLSIAVVLIFAVLVTCYVILSSYDFNSLKPRIAQAVKNATGRELILGGDIELKIGLMPVIAIENVNFENAAWGLRPELAKARRFELEVDLLPIIVGNIKIKRLTLVEPDILIETDNTGRWNLEFGPAEKDVHGEPKKEAPGKGWKLWGVKCKEVRVERGRLTYRRHESEKSYEVALDGLITAQTGDERQIELKLEGGVHHGEPFEVEGTLGRLSDLIDPGTRWPFMVNMRSGGASITVNGAIRDAVNATGIDLHVSAEGDSISDVFRLGNVRGIPQVGPFTLTMKVVDTEAATYKASDIKITLGESDLGGSAELSLGGKRPQLKAILSSRKVDLRPYFSKEGGRGGGPGQPVAKQAKIFSDNPLPLSALTHADANLKIRAGRVLLPRLALNDLSIEMRLEEGSLRVAPLEAAIGGGTLYGSFHVDSKGRAATAKAEVKIAQLDLGRMLREASIKDIFEGETDLDIQLNSHGNSVAALMAGLSGKTIMAMNQGRIKKKYVDLLGADLRFSLLRLLNPFTRERDFTEIDCFFSRFDITEGVAKSTALVFDTPDMSVVGDGQINLNTEQLDLSLKPFPKKGIGAKGIGKLSLSLGQLAESFRLGGTLADPKLTIDSTRGALTFGKALGGVALFGPVGIAAALARGSSDEENRCLAAIEAAKRGVKFTDQKKLKEEKGVVEKAAKEIRGALRKIFRK